MGSRMGVCVCVGGGVFNNPLFFLKPKPISATFCHETSCLPARVLHVQVQARGWKARQLFKSIHIELYVVRSSLM